MEIFMILTLAKLAKIALAAILLGGAVATVAILTRDSVGSWIAERTGLLKRDPNKVAFSVLEKLEKGEYEVYTVISDQKTGKVVDYQRQRSTQIEPELVKMHGETGVVKWQVS